MEEWKNICDKIEGREGVWEFETDEKELIKDYLIGTSMFMTSFDNEAKDAEVILTIHVDEEHKAAEYALGTWSDDVGYEYDNRIYEDDDYGGVIEWLNKIAEKGGIRKCRG